MLCDQPHQAVLLYGNSQLPGDAKPAGDVAVAGRNPVAHGRAQAPGKIVPGPAAPHAPAAGPRLPRPVGYAQKECAARFERHIKGWPTPSLVTPIRGSTLEKDIWRKGCNAFGKPKELPDAAFNNSGPNNLGLNSDALLYLGPRKELVTGPRDLDIILDLEYRAEMDRRMVLRTGQPMGPPNTARNVPQPFFTD